MTVRPQPGDITRSTDANGSPVFSGTGTPTQPGARTLLGTVAAPRNMAPEARAASIETQRDITNNATGASEVVGASALNGLSPQSELMRRFEISQGGFKGSPSARRMAGEAILGTIGQMNGATVAGAAGASQAALAGQEDQVAGNENFARRRFDASKFNVDTGEARDARDMVGRTFNRTLDAADGTTSALSNDGTLTPLKNSDGTSFRQLPDPSRRTTVSPDAEFRALSEELTALAQTPGEGSMVRAAQIQTRMEQLTGQGALSAKGPTLEAFLTAARKANPQASQDELTSYFNRTYGS